MRSAVPPAPRLIGPVTCAANTKHVGDMGSLVCVHTEDGWRRIGTGWGNRVCTFSFGICLFVYLVVGCSNMMTIITLCQSPNFKRANILPLGKIKRRWGLGLQ